MARGPLFALVTLAALSCKGTEPVTTGTVQVTAATAGQDLDLDGYSLELVGDKGVAGGQSIARNGAATFTHVAPGSYTLNLNNAAENCPVVGGSTRSVTVTVGETAEVDFQVTCIGLVDVTGVWNYTAQVGDPLTCNDTGSVDVTQSGSIVSGSTSRIGTCDWQDGSIDHSFAGAVNGAPSYSPAGASVRFTDPACTLTADVVGTPPDRLINGVISCPWGSGTWSAVRGGGAIASVSVSSPPRVIVVGGTARLRAVLIDASGSRRVGPTVTWTSDASGTASVDAAGIVSGVGPGSATITATAEDKAGTAAAAVEVVAFTSVQTGAYHSCGLATSGAAYCWGNGTYGQIGSGSRANGLAPVAVANGLIFTAISVGAIHTCGLSTSGAAYCWGSNAFGELGGGTLAGQRCGTEGIACIPFPLAVAGGLTFSSLSPGWDFSCGLTSAGLAYCWGEDAYGELGDGSTTLRSTPTAVSGGLVFASAGSGIVFACGLTPAGAAYCWGNNSVGQLGIGPTSPETCRAEPCSSAPVPVSGGLTFTDLSVGYWHACGLTADGTAYCWGDNGDAQLGATGTETCSGFGTTIACSTSPIPVDGGLRFTKLRAGDFQSCGVTSTGDGYCWGANDAGQLGNGTGTSGATPTPIGGGLTFADLSPNGRFHSCGLSTAGIAYCWGANYWGQVGAGVSALTPVEVTGQTIAPAPAPARAVQVSRAAARIPVPRPSARPPRP